MLTTKVFLLIVLVATNRFGGEPKPSQGVIPMDASLTHQEQVFACSSLKDNLMIAWEDDPVISRLNVSLTCVDVGK